MSKKGKGNGAANLLTTVGIGSMIAIAMPQVNWKGTLVILGVFMFLTLLISPNLPKKD
ncbi:MAG: hypothetical protein PHD20_02120 [Clostridia bacterium]|nr:hypothetical protein [Clostridia bacterium]